MQEMIDVRKNQETKDERHDLFSLLLDASEAETDGEQKMKNSDLIGALIILPTLYCLIMAIFYIYIYPNVGNIFVFLLAGHEVRYLIQIYIALTYQTIQTTAHTMAFALAMLAMYQDEQETLYKHIKSVIPDGRIPVCNV